MSVQRAISLLVLTCFVQACGRARADYRAQTPDAEPLHAAMNQLTGVMVYDIFSSPGAG